jgi:hypothetical protein
MTLVPFITGVFMNAPCISIDRAARSWAIFDGFNLVHDFTPYTDEKDALQTARAVVARATDVEPEIVYPRIDSVRVKTSRVRRKK